MSRRTLLATPPIRLTPEVYRLYRETIALAPPETFAILGGRLEDPFCVTDFRFCPPKRTANGDFDASGVHINIDHDFMNFVVDHEWVPAGKYMLGCWHSHPSGFNRLSDGDTTTNTGDIAFMTTCLDHDDSPDRAWRFFLAPLTTFAPDGTDQVHGWVLKRGERTPRATRVIVDPFAPSPLAELLPSGALPSLAPFILSEVSHEPRSRT